MDTSRIFDTLDRKIEKLLERLETVEQENDRMKVEVASARRAEKDAADSRGAVEKLKAELAAARRSEKEAADSAAAALGRGEARTVYQYIDLAAFYARQRRCGEMAALLIEREPETAKMNAIP